MASMMVSSWMPVQELPSPPPSPVNILGNTMESKEQALPVSVSTSKMRTPILPLLKMIIDTDDDVILNKDGVNRLQQSLQPSLKTHNTS